MVMIADGGVTARCDFRHRRGIMHDDIGEG